MSAIGVLAWVGVGLAVFGLAWWWIEVGSARRHMRQAHRETLRDFRQHWPRR